MSERTLLVESIALGEDRWRPLRGLHDGWRAVRSITWGGWLWTTLLGLFAIGAYLAGIAPRSFTTWQMSQFVATTIYGLLGAYLILIAIRIAEYRRPNDNDRARGCWIAGAGATIIMVVVETTGAALFPRTIGATSMPGVERLIGAAVSALMNWSLCGALAIAVYVRLQSVRRARAAIRAAELARAEASREVLASRLAAMQAQVEPKLLLSTLAQIEVLYDRDVDAGARMLNALIGYLRTALPQLRGGSSTLGREARLAQSYLELVRLRMGTRLDFAIDVPPSLADVEMPPMVLLPLIECALRDGLEPLPFGGRLGISARAEEGRMCVTVVDNGLAPRGGVGGAADLAALRARLQGLYGSAARLVVADDPPRGVTAVVELPHETKGAHR